MIVSNILSLLKFTDLYQFARKLAIMNGPVLVPANRKGGYALIYDNFRYVRNRKTKTNLWWRCSNAGCGSYLKSNLFDVEDIGAVIQGILFMTIYTFLFTVKR